MLFRKTAEMKRREQEDVEARLAETARSEKKRNNLIKKIIGVAKKINAHKNLWKVETSDSYWTPYLDLMVSVKSDGVHIREGDCIITGIPSLQKRLEEGEFDGAFRYNKKWLSMEFLHGLKKNLEEILIELDGAPADEKYKK